MGNKTSQSKSSCKVCSHKAAKKNEQYVFTSHVISQNLPKICKTLPDSEVGEDGECSTGYRNEDGSLKCQTNKDCKLFCTQGLKWTKSQNDKKGKINGIGQLLSDEGERLCKIRDHPKKCDDVFISVFDKKTNATGTGLYTCS